MALISSSYHPYAGGVEEHVRHVARELTERGHAVVVWTVDRGEHLGTQTVDGVRVHYLPAPLPARSGRALLRYAADFPYAWRRWVTAHREFQPDVLHVQCFGPNGLYALGLHHRFGTPLVVSSHGETFADDHAVFDRSALLRAGMRRSLTRASVVTGCSRYVLDDLRDRFNSPPGLVVPNGVDLRPGPAPQLPGSGDRTDDTLPTTTRPYVFAVGRLGRMKGFDLLIDAFAETGLGHELDLVIGGDGDQRDALATQAHRLGLSGQIHLVGRLDPDDVALHMAGATTVVVPSRMEAFGIVALEAWRSGAPLIMSSRGGGPDLVSDEVDGILVDPTVPTDLADAIRRVCSDTGLRASLSRNGRGRVGQYTWAASARAYEDIYEALTPRRDGAVSPRVLLNGKWTAQPVTGTQRYAMEVTRRLIASAPDEFTVQVPRDAQVPGWLSSGAHVRRSRLRGTVFEQVALPCAARGRLVVSLGGPAPILARRQIATLHDAGAFRLSSTYSPLFARWYRLMYRVLARRATGLLTVSDFSVGELAEVLHVPASRFAVAGNGCDHVDEVVPVRPDLTVAEPFVLCIGTFARHKNLPETLTALDAAGHRVIVVGASGSDQVFETERVEPWKHVTLAGRLSDPEIVWLYRRAHCLVFPSMYEGFGLPVIEAQRLGCPVVCSDRASLPEVAGEGAVIVGATDPVAFVEAVEQLRTDPSFRAALIEAGAANATRHLWARTAEQVRKQVILAQARGR